MQLSGSVPSCFYPALKSAKILMSLLLLSLSPSKGIAAVTYVSDLTWTFSSNNYGPVEKDRSNGEDGAGDGRTLRVAGKSFTKGLGVNATSEVRYIVGGTCQTFTSEIGVDDEVGWNGKGSVVFQVWGDGTKRYESGVRYGGAAALPISVNISNVTELKLIVTTAGDTGDSDHADWGNAQVNCNSVTPPVTPPPVTPPPTGGLVTSAPMVIDAKSNITVKGVKITNNNGPCIIIRNAAVNIRVENSELGPCSGGGIVVFNAGKIVVSNVYIHHTGTSANGIDVSYGTDVQILGNRLEYVRSGIWALNSRQIKIEKNRFLNVLGPMPRGQFVQFDKVTGSGNRIKCNVGENVLGASYPEEAINIYESSGESTDPIQIVGNKIKGGGPSGSGGGIMLGDNGGAYIVASDNILVNPGQQGIAVASGRYISVLNNYIFSRQLPFSNVGLTVWNQYGSACNNITVQGNNVNFKNSTGYVNPTFNVGNCGSVAGWTNNNWNATFGEEIWDRAIPACAY